MTDKQAQEQAARLGLSAWQAEAIRVGSESEAVVVYCVGFSSLGLPIAEAETWEEALREVARIIFSA